jgi:branched-subunit amino acid ABC-type transport system permease component
VRLRPITSDLPKPLIPVDGVPAICRILDTLSALGADRAVITVRYRADDIIRLLGDSYAGIRLFYSREEQPRGTAGGVRDAWDRYAKDTDTDALIISGDAPVNIAVAVVIMVALTWFTSRTRTGKAMRAVSEDRDAAALMGINVNRTISVTFAIGSGLAAVAGVLLWHKTNLQPTFGAMPGIKAFTAAVLGGVGSMPGAMLGGVLLGLVETLSKAYISTQFSDAIVFSVLIVILLVKPTGILGKKIQEKV